MNVYDIVDKEDQLIDLLSDILGDERKHYHNKKQVSFDCPNCSGMKGVDYDGKGNLEINYELGLYNCWSCSETHGTKGFIYNLIKEFGTYEQLKQFLGLKLVFGDGYFQKETVIENKPKLTLPEFFIPLAGKQHINHYKAPFKYLEGRGITNNIIEKYNIGFCFDGKYQNRVVIPSYDKNGELNYYITRSISSLTKKYKYLNPDVDKTQIIFNERFIDWDKPVFLVEGGFDHIVVDNSLPLLGKKLYDKLFKIIYENSNNFIIIVLDPDAYDDCIQIYHKLNAGKLMNRVLINKLPEDYDVSLFNQVYGSDQLKKWLSKKNFRLND